MKGATSCRWTVASGAPQGSVLGLVLFSISISILDAGVERILTQFTDDTKLGGVVDSLEGWRVLAERFRLENHQQHQGQRKMLCSAPVFCNASHEYSLGGE